MNNLDDIEFDPQLGLFVNRNDPTAHLSPREIKNIRKKPRDPEAEKMKPRINFFRHDKSDSMAVKGETVNISWNVDNADFVKIRFPDGYNVEFPTVGTSAFIMPPENCELLLVAKHGKYRSQQTIKVKKITKMNRFLHKIF